MRPERLDAFDPSLPSMALRGLGFAILMSSVLWALILLMVGALMGSGPEGT
jgi:hypothetical protein